MTYPILLAHGIARFDALAQQFAARDRGDTADDRLHYFRRIRSTLEAAGFPTVHSSVPFAASVTVRSYQLRANVEDVLARTGAARVHIIAHSMGGLDARHMLFDGRDDGVHRRVASLTTIGTPHLGTSFADWGIRHTRDLFRLFEFAGIRSLDGFLDLTTDACREFDARARGFEESSGVLFQTVVGTQELPLIFGPLQLSSFILREREGPNDGLVSQLSAMWRAPYIYRHVDADHLNQVGWWDPNELGLRFFPSLGVTDESRREMEQRIRDLYLDIARDLARRFP